MIEKVDVRTHPYVSVLVDGVGHWEMRFRERCQYAEEAIANRRNRDGYGHHVTVADWRETRSHDVLVPEHVTLEPEGFGHVVDDEGNEAWFVVITSPELDAVREASNLPPKDFHITLGFIGKDVHGVRKNRVIDAWD